MACSANITIFRTLTKLAAVKLGNDSQQFVITAMATVQIITSPLKYYGLRNAIDGPTNFIFLPFVGLQTRQVGW